MTSTDQLDLEQIHLDKGSHNSPQQGHCLMEVVSMFAKEPFTDRPECVSPYLRSFGISLNDRATDKQRQDLLRFVTRVVGTAGDGKDERRRWMAADHVTRVVTPRWLDRAGLFEQATALRALTPVTDRPTYDQSRDAVRTARDAAYKLRQDRLRPMREKVREAVTKALSEKKPVAAAAAVVAVDAVAAVVDAVAAAVDAADAVAAVAAESANDRYWRIRDRVYSEVYAKVRAAVEERYGDLLTESWDDALDLYDRLISCPE